MSGWEYDEIGEFSSAAAAEDWARDNGLDPRDVDIKGGFSGKARVWVRRGTARQSDSELRNSRKRGFF